MMPYDDSMVAMPMWDDVPRNIAELRWMPNGLQVAVCSIWTHPEGAELRMMIDDKLRMVWATHHTWLLSTLALGWQSGCSGCKAGADLV